MSIWMDHLVIAWVTVAYGLGAVLVTYRQLRGHGEPSILGWWLVALGFFTHLVAMSSTLMAHHGAVAFDLKVSLEFVSLAVALLYLVSCRIPGVEAPIVGIVVLPMLALSVLASRVLPQAHRSELLTVTHPILIAHLVMSLLAYGLLTIAAIFALMDAFQDHALKSKHLGRLFHLLPALYRLETTLYHMVEVGFALLTFSIISGGIYSWQQHGTLFAFNHKVIFTWATWISLATLFVGRYYWGWRGVKGAKFILSGYLFLVLAFFGVKWVRGYIL
ncbi:MAG: cytochrome c biogenesis protein CcsA [Magnetococcales bacterium]|nr:cytochrome c biogenesis protein CcsA [Magnetococcales bacterium]MBF0150923.1 cytochrome c biogenesis protein CcsA [Magnetococcales bacterium]MBF0347471.1 cytochrome c biogenesis protein CcsA [Magnetococcales bacterium]MBF0631436.1 cytochrome c biogenesis protein CcsA [Magnetococcales bacterium]